MTGSAKQSRLHALTGTTTELTRQFGFLARVKMRQHDARHDHDRGCEKRPDRSPQPSPERDAEKKREWMQVEHLPADDRRRQELAFDHGDGDERCWRNERTK